MDPRTMLAHFRAIVQGSDDAIASKDLSGIIQSWNPGAQRIFGYSAREAIGKPMTLIFPPDRFPEEAKILATIARGERIDHYETIRRRKDGSLVEVSVTVSPIHDENGVVVGASKIARDISARVRTERELRAANERLAQVDAQRRDFLNVVAHEVRSPLTPTMIHLELLSEALQGDPRHALVERVDRNLRRLRSLLDDLLVLARFDQAKIPTHRHPLDLAAVAREVVDDLQAAADRSGVQLLLSGPTDVPILADERRVVQVVTNLVSNAMKFTPRGGRIEVSVTLDGGEARLSVTDDGVGFSHEDARRLFQPFSRLHSDRPGNGLGLYLSQLVAKEHGGHIMASSPGVGKGATFTLALPCLRAAPSSATQRRA